MELNYAKIKTNCTSNGIGIRVALFVSGCPFHCKNCSNPESWNPNYGKTFTSEVKEKLFKELEKTYYRGLTLLGGSPLASYNIEETTQLAREFKQRFSDEKDLWIYTGYSFEDVINFEVLNYTDILVDGLYVDELYSPKLRFRGSSNQSIIDVKESLKQNKKILAKQYYESE